MKRLIVAAVISAGCCSARAKTPTVVLEAPERVYAGETFPVKLRYQSQNTQNPLPAPIFEVVSTGQLFHVSGSVYTNRAWFLGLSTNAAAPGTLAKKESGELSFSVTAGDGPVAWNVILHEAGQGGGDAAFPLDRLFTPERLARNDGCVAILKENIGETWEKFYTKFGNYLSGDYPMVYADFWKTVSVFAETKYFTAYAEALSSPSLTQAQPALSGRTLAAASCTHKSSTSISDATTDSYDGTIWWYCPSCTTWRLCLKGAFESSPKIYESSLDWSRPVYVIATDSSSKLQTGNVQNLATTLLGKGTVLGVCWTYGGSRNIPAKSVDHSAETVARHLKLLGADPTKITFIAVGYGAHVAANAIALYEGDSGDARPFARLVALDPLTTEYGILAESVQASTNLFLRAASKCSQIDLYRSSWNRSLARADQLFGHYNFALWPEGGFYPKTLEGEWSRGDGALAWFIATVTNSTAYANLGFNFAGLESWTALCGATVPPPSGSFAGVIDGEYLELANYVTFSGSESAARYAETMRVDDGAANVIEPLFEKLAGVIDYSVDEEAAPGLDAAGKTVTFTVRNGADNLAVPYDALAIFAPKPFVPWRKGFAAGVWLVDLTGLSTKVPAAELDAADGAGLLALLRENGGAAFARCIGEVRTDAPVRFVAPQESMAFSVPVRVRNDCFGAAAPILGTGGARRETTLLLAAGAMAGGGPLPEIYEGDLDTRNNVACFDAAPAVVPFFAEVSVGGRRVAQGALMEVAADAGGSWTAELSGLQAEDTDGHALSYVFDIVAETNACTVSVTTDGAAGALASGTLADGLSEGRYTVSVTVGNGTGSDTLSFTLVVTREVSAPGVSQDVSATLQDGSLTAYIQMLDADTPKITWEADLPGRTYTVKGKVSLSDEEWVAPTNSAHRFFKVFADPAPVVPRALP